MTSEAQRSRMIAPAMGALVLVVALLAGMSVSRARAQAQSLRAAHPAQQSGASLHAAVVRSSGQISRHAATSGTDLASPAFASLLPLPASTRAAANQLAPLRTASDGSAPTYDATAPPLRLRTRFS